MRIPLFTLMFACGALFGQNIMLVYEDAVPTVVNIADIDSMKVTGSVPGQSLTVFRSSGNIVKSLSLIDSITFGMSASRVLDPLALFNAFQADTIRLKADTSAVTLDARHHAAGFTGLIETDAIDLLDSVNSGVSVAAPLTKLTVATVAATPSGTAIALSIKSGNSLFSETGWSGWTVLGSLNSTSTALSGRYVKLRYVLSTNSVSALPEISRVTLTGEYHLWPAFSNTLSAASFTNEKIITSPFAFGWESRTQSAIQGLVTGYRLDTCGTNSSTEFGKVVALLDWVARRPQIASYSWNPYPWDLGQVWVSGSVKGHCMSYAEVMISALTGLGYYARHWAIEGLEDWNENNHEVVEYWSNARKKWIYLDPSLDTWYGDYSTNEPLSILEMHNINVRGDSIRCNDGHYHYGDYEPVYDWQWKQGYTTCGYMKLTERNNFHSQPSPAYNGFGLGFCGFSDLNRWHTWTDTATPPYPDSLHYSCEGAVITCHRGRVRDFWYTLNQAAISAKRIADNTLSLEFGNSQPFFKQYMISVDNGGYVVAASPYAWTLHSGNNRLVVAPEDNWAARGLPSEIQVNR